MRLLEFDKDASLASVIAAIKAVPEKQVTLRIPSDTPWLANPVNEKILRKSVQQFGKDVHFDGRPDPISEPIVSSAVQSAPEPLSEVPVSSGPAATDEAGFMVGGDVMAQAPAPPEIVTAAPAPVATFPPAGEFKVNGGGGSRFKSVMAKLSKRWPLTVVAVLGLLLLGGAYVVFALPKADVKVIVEQRPLEREATLTASSNVTKIDVDARKIPATIKTSTQSGSTKTSTTGKKTVGTNAKGTVTIYNGTDFDKTFSAGQKMTATSASGSAKLKFSLDQTVSVPKRSPGALPLSFTSGSSDVQVTATEIGSQYNLSANTNFTLDGYDSTTFQGKNSTAISGGSSRDVQVVAQADLDKLLSDETKDLSDKAKADLTKNGSSDDKILDQAMKTAVVTKSYDHKVGDEAPDVTINLTLSVRATIYNAKDLKEILTKTLEQAAPDGYEVSPEGQETSAEVVSVESNGDLTFIGRIRANLIPKFDKDKLARDLSGKKPAVAESYLKAIPSVQSYTVNIWPNLPDFFKAFPRDTKRIHIQVTVQ